MVARWPSPFQALGLGEAITKTFGVVMLVKTHQAQQSLQILVLLSEGLALGEGHPTIGNRTRSDWSLVWPSSVPALVKPPTYGQQMLSDDDVLDRTILSLSVQHEDMVRVEDI